MLSDMSSSTQTKTIHEFLADAPNVDRMELWTALWGILSEAKDKITAELDVQPYPSGEGLEYWTSEDGGYEGSLNPYVGDPDNGVEWLVHSWIGNRKNSILDMNLQVWLGPHIDVPHLVLVFGTVPNVFHFSDVVPRRDPMVDVDYLNKYFEPENQKWLDLRGDDRFLWSVSHGTYMRAFNSPIANSYMATCSDAEAVERFGEAVRDRVDTWLQWVRDAEPVPAEERAALRQRDHQVREYGYTMDPMNELSKKFLGEQRVNELVATRAGLDQIAALEGRA